MPGFDLSAARKAGYSDDEILKHLTETRKFDIAGALNAGYSKSDIISYLAQRSGGYTGDPGDVKAVKAWLDERYPKLTEEPASTLSLIGDFLKGSVVNTAKGVYDIGKRLATPPQDTRGRIAAAVAGPAGPLISDIAAAHAATAGRALERAMEAVRQLRTGNYREALGASSEAAGYGLATALPGVGPAAAAVGEKIGEGIEKSDPHKAAEGAGEAFMMTVAPAVASLVKRVPVVPRFGRNLNAQESAAVNFGLREGIPVDAATATGNKAIAGIQQTVEYSPLGAGVAQRARLQQTEALRATSERLANRAYAQPIVKEQAGAAVQKNLNRQIEGLKAIEDAAYSRFRQLEGQHLQTVQVGIQLPGDAMATLDNLSQSLAGRPFKKLTTAEQNGVIDTARRLGLDIEPKPVMQEMAMPVDMRPIKDALRPEFERQTMWIEPAKTYASPGYKAMKSIIEGPDYLPASIAEEGLSGLKRMAREAKSGALRNVNQGVAAHAVKMLQDAIDTTVGAASQEALKALRMGRAKHAAKMSIDEVLSELRTEPVQLVQQLSYAKDAGIELLRRVQKIAPGEMAKVGRAILEDLFGKSAAEGGWNRAASVWSEWERIGPETKKILYPDPKLRQDLDNFFLLAKRMAERPNPSGSAVVGSLNFGLGYMLRNPVAGTAYMISGPALAKALYSPRTIRLLTEGLQMPLGNRAAAGMLAAQIERAIGDELQPLDTSRQLTASGSPSGPGATAAGMETTVKALADAVYAPFPALASGAIASPIQVSIPPGLLGTPDPAVVSGLLGR